MPRGYCQPIYSTCSQSTSPVLVSIFKPPFPIPSTSDPGPPPSLSLAHLAQTIVFDLCVVQGSLLLDITSHTLAAIHLSSSPLIFTMVTSISAFATGASTALQSLTICILQRSQPPGSPDTGALFGGLSMLTALRHILAVSPSFTLHTLVPYPVLTVLCLVAACSRSFLAWST
jgi:hypothetical protein